MPSNKANLGCGNLTLQWLVYVFNLVFFACGLILILIGGIAQGFFKEYIKFFENEYKSPAMGLIILGTIILIVSFFGCCGAKKQNIYMLNTFSFLISILLVGEVAAAITIAVLRNDIEGVVAMNMNSTMYEYGNNKSLVDDTWDDMQEKFHCCGTANYTDWGNTPWGKWSRVPDSCCKNFKPKCGEGQFVDPNFINLINTDGCLDSLKASAKHNLGAIIGAAVGIAIIQVIGLWMSYCLVRAVRDNYEVL